MNFKGKEWIRAWMQKNGTLVFGYDKGLTTLRIDEKGQIYMVATPSWRTEPQ